jgi:hypothetical protein
MHAKRNFSLTILNPGNSEQRTRYILNNPSDYKITRVTRSEIKNITIESSPFKGISETAERFSPDAPKPIRAVQEVAYSVNPAYDLASASMGRPLAHNTKLHMDTQYKDIHHWPGQERRVVYY